MIVQAVVSKNRGNEGYWIAFLCAFILVAGALLLPFNKAHQAHPNLAKHQVMVTALDSKPLAMISELRLAFEEIHYAYQANQSWPSVTELEEQWLPPFVKDKSWEHQGKYQWSLIAPGFYQGKPAEVGTRYLLNSTQEQVDIWFQLDASNTLLPSNFKLEDLINNGWTQVVSSAVESETAHQH